MAVIRPWIKSEFQFSLIGTLQRNPAVAVLNDGSYVMFWENQGPERIGSTADTIRGQRFSEEGDAIGAPITIGLLGFSIRNPEVTALPDGGYLVSYDRVFSTGVNGVDADIDVLAQRFSETGTTVGGTIFIDTEGGNEADAAIATVGGDVAFVYRDAELATGDIEYKLFDFATSSVIASSNASASAALSQEFADISTSKTTGRQLVVALSQENPLSIRASLYESNGAAVVLNAQIATAAGFLNAPTVTALAQGGFVVTWHESVVGGFDIKAQLVNANGAPVGGEIRVSGPSTDLAVFPDVAALNNGGFAVVWAELDKTVPNIASLRLRTFDSSGTATSDEYAVNTAPIFFLNGSTPVGHQRQSWNVAALEDDRLVVSWESDVSFNGTQFNVFSRIIDPRDGIVNGTNATESVYGNNGIADTIIAKAGNDYISSLGGNDKVYGGDGNDRMFAGRGDDRMYGGNGNDEMHGSDGKDILYGGLGNDRMFGTNGADVIRGDGGTDSITGGLDRDLLYGGTGRDRFDFNLVSESLGAGRDLIRDFVRGLDDIDLRTIDANTAVGGNQAFRFIGNSPFNGNAGELHIRQVGALIKVEGDTNGDRVADFTIDVTGAAPLSAGDFFL